MLDFNRDNFIKNHITKRDSLFVKDIELNRETLKEEIEGRNVLVIGGAGTIGSAYIKAVLKYRPDSLHVVDYSENGLTELTRDLRSTKDLYIPSKYITYPFDFGSKIFAKLLKENNYDIIACFAAHKHVRSEKDHLAIEAMVNNNVFNTLKLIELSLKNKPKHFFSVSTDKAANPVNVMGASKKLMEKVLLSYSNVLKITTARFANVAFSNGSLLYGFIERIMKRQPISAPSDVKRYFVSPEESGQLCMLASILGKSGNIIFPKLSKNEMMTFSTIAEMFLNSLGYSCDYCNNEQEAKEKAAVWKPEMDRYPVYFFKSSTSGEKMYEEFYDQNDKVDFDTFENLGIIYDTEKLSHDTIKNLIKEFKELFESKINKRDIIDLLNKHIPNFSHIETGISLDQKM